MKFKLPKKRTKGWIGLALKFNIVLLSALMLITKLVLLLDIDIEIFIQLAIVATVISTTLCFLGYFALNYVFIFALIGLVFGLFYMGYVFLSNNIEIKGIIGVLALFESIIVGGIIGINIQLISYLIKKRVSRIN
jgi:hypothetical protein